MAPSTPAVWAAWRGRFQRWGRNAPVLLKGDAAARLRIKEARPIMPHIILTAEQAQVALRAGEPVEVRDEQGRTVAHLNPLHPADIEAIEQSKRSRVAGGPRVPSDQVQAHLQHLGEVRQREALDEPTMLDLLRMRAGERG